MRPFGCFLLTLTISAHAQCPPNAAACNIKVTENGGTITSSTMPSHSNSSTVAAAQLSTVAALTAFIYLRPALQTMHNNKINAVESYWQEEYQQLNDLMAIEVPSVATVPAKPSVQGHSLGESWKQFLSISPKTTANVASCMKRPPLKQTEKHQVFDPCASIRYLEGGGTRKITMTCRSSDLAKNLLCRDFDGEITFVNQFLVAMKIILPGVTIADAEMKFGRPSGSDKDLVSKLWRGSSYAVAADSTNSGIALAWATTSYLADETRVEPTSEPIKDGQSIVSKGANF